jgi:hypothetical protein
VKVWFHVIASVVGLLLAGLIVFAVFGNASREGALQDGTAGGRATADGTVCGSVPIGQVNTPEARRKALANPPTLIGAKGTAVSLTDPAQRSWLAKVQAGSGLCIDEIEIGEANNDTTKITLSTVKGVTEAEASAYTGAALLAANQQPLSGRNVQITTFVGDQPRTLFVSVRFYAVFLASRKAYHLGTTASDVVKFRKRVPGFKAADVKILGWR